MLSKVILFGKIFVLIIQHSCRLLRTWVRSRIHRLTYQPGSQPKNIVIIGASFAGYHAARCLANSIPSGYRVVVIEKHSHFHLTWVLPRFCVVEGHDHKAFIPYGDGSYIQGPAGSSQWIRDTVETILPSKEHNGGQLQLASGDMIGYEYLVLATGSSAELPSRIDRSDKPDGMSLLAAEREKITAAQDIVVIGGGAAGIELATDVKSRFPNKQVTLIHSHKTLLNDGFGLKLHDVICKEMDRLGVNLVLGERPTIPDPESGDIKLGGGTIHYDCLIKCIGQKPNSHLVRDILSPETFSRAGYLQVRPSLQVDEQFPHIYAAGDVIEGETIKNARSATEQAQVVAENICRQIRGEQPRAYRCAWWEGATKLTLGIGKSVIYITDHHAELVKVGAKQKIELDSGMVWKHLGQTPFIDGEDPEVA